MTENILSNHRDKSPEYYKYYPKLFHAYFPNIQEVSVKYLSKAGYSYYNSILYLDLLVDNNDFRTLPLMLQQQEECIKILTEIFGSKSRFWSYWNTRKQEYFEAINLEKKYLTQKTTTFKQYSILAEKKSAFGNIAIDCLYTLTGCKHAEVYNILLESHKYFSIGFQLYDDIKDFKEDFENGQFNWAIYSVLQQQFSHKNTVNILNKLLFISGIGQEILQQSIYSFEKSLNLVKSIAVDSLWEKTIIEMKQTITNYLDYTNGYIKRLEKQIETKNDKKNINAFFKYLNIEGNEIINGLNFIRKDYENNYAELKHYMYLSNLEGFQNTNQVHVSDTFQRAILNDCLLVVNQKFKLDNDSFFEKESAYIMNRINHDEIGGWSYFPTVPEISADIDDLGQIIQFFYNTANEKLIKDNCLLPIHLIITERACLQGGYETWILPREQKSNKQIKQEYFNATKWGKGPDVEVVANFAYALEIFDSKTYINSINRSLSFISAMQEEEGYWKSRWYYGQYYGTYVCLRLLNKYPNKYSKNNKIALEFILTNQNEDGGFALAKNLSSDPLSTAFAILCLKLFTNQEIQNINRAVQFVKSTQNSNGSWDAVDFIIPRINHPYKSSTMTTALVLKALCT